MAHIGNNVYAGAVLVQLSEREAEAKLAAKRKAKWRLIDTKGSRSSEIMALLGLRGEMTVRAIRQTVFGDLDMKEREVDECVRTYLKALEKAGMVEVRERSTNHGFRWFVRPTTRPVEQEPPTNNPF